MALTAVARPPPACGRAPFTGYHVHVPWGMPATLLDMFLLAYPTKRYRSAWVGIADTARQSLVLAILIFTLVV